MQHTVAVVEGVRAVWLAPECEMEVVGESFNTDHLGKLVAAGCHNAGPSLVAWLVPEPDNAHDSNAVMVWLAGGRVGYLSRPAAKAWQGELLALMGYHNAQVACSAEIRGAERPGVWLRVPSDAPMSGAGIGRTQSSRTSGAAEFTIDVNQVLGELVGNDPEFAAQVDAYIERRERYVASLSPAERAAYEADQRRQEEQLDRQQAQRQQTFELEQRAREERHAQIEADRAAGLVGTQTELGRPFGLSAVAVGRILDEHKLRERVPVHVAGVEPPLTLMRAVAAGYAIFDEYSGREYWVVAKVEPLLALKAGRKASK
jgi:hypothetical protein